MPEVLAGGTELWTAVTGEGPPVVCCHGGPGLWDYLGSLAALIDSRYTVVRFDQRGCGRSSGRDGPFTIKRALADLDELRAALGFERWAVLGHSWGAELAVRYAAAYPERVSTVVYLAGVGAGDGFREGFAAEYRGRLGDDFERWRELRSRERTPDEEHEFCLLQWRPDYSPGPNAVRYAERLWSTRPPGAEINTRAHELWADRSSTDLLEAARGVRAHVTMILGADDPRPWRATDSLVDALPDVERIVIEAAGHSPWVEQPDEVRQVLLTALRPVTTICQSGRRAAGTGGWLGRSRSAQ